MPAAASASAERIAWGAAHEEILAARGSIPPTSFLVRHMRSMQPRLARIFCALIHLIPVPVAIASGEAGRLELHAVSLLGPSAASRAPSSQAYKE
jgi:hypothetical protein